MQPLHHGSFRDGHHFFFRFRRSKGPEAISQLVALVLLLTSTVFAMSASGASLNAATIQGDIKKVAALLAEGTSPDFSDTAHNGAHPLHRCAWRGFPDIAELLLKAGATVDCTNTMGATPLMNTAITNQPAVTKVLLAHGADRSLKNVRSSLGGS